MVVKLSGGDLEHARKQFSSVFKTADAFDEPFEAAIYQKAVLYPLDYQLDESHLKALQMAAAQTGENSAYLFLTEGKSGFDHWRVELQKDFYGELSRDPDWIPIAENCIFSIHGTWGLLFSHESHAVIGGSRLFLKTFARNLPNMDQEVREFLRAWKYNHERYKSAIDWLPRFLTHVYGEKAGKFLTESHLDLK